MQSVSLIIAVLALMVFLNSLYVAAEFSSVSSRKTRVRKMADSGNRLAKMLLPIVSDTKKLDDYIAASQLGITASSLVLGAFGQNTVAMSLVPLLINLGAMAEPAAQSIAITLVLLFLTLLQIVFGELLPKSVALRYPERLALLTVIPMRGSVFLFRPFIWLFNGSGNLALRLAGVESHRERAHVHSPEEIELLVSDSHEGGQIDEEEQSMLLNVFRLRDLTARKVMIPRVRIAAAPVESTFTELIALSCKTGFSRIPLYRASIDNIVGFVHIKDLFRLHRQGKEDIKAVKRDVIYIPDSQPIIDVWHTLSSKRQYLAIILDEYGGTAGVITFEDLIEEIFGDLQDEFDDELELISTEKDGRIRLRSDMLIADVNDILNLELPDDEVDTLGGLVFSRLGHVPKVGEEVIIGPQDTKIRVEAMVVLRVTEVSLSIQETDQWQGAHRE